MVANEIVSATNLKLADIQPERVESALRHVRDVQKVIKELLIPEYDYGIIPNCSKKPVLFKPGAEKIIAVFQFGTRVECTDKTVNFDGLGFFAYEYKFILFSGRLRVCEGVGSCNSKEAKFRYKWVEKYKVPKDVDINTLTRKNENGRTVYLIEDEVCSKANTIQKMAKKRAMIDAVLQVSSLSEVFIQDFDDMNDEIPAEVSEPLQPGKQIPSEEAFWEQDTSCATPGCKGRITSAIAEYSKKEFGKVYCMNCQNKLRTKNIKNSKK